MLNNHAAIVAVLGEGSVKIQGEALEIEEVFRDRFTKEGTQFSLSIGSGTVEMKENKVVLLVD
jgi:F-type H+-transporting ATPase subunit epsilon